MPIRERMTFPTLTCLPFRAHYSIVCVRAIHWVLDGNEYRNNNFGENICRFVEFTRHLMNYMMSRTTRLSHKLI